MRSCLLILVLAQGMQLQTPNPDATAANADWQIRDEPIVASGLTYYPTRETRMFDGQVMTQVDVYKGVPVYADMSREPFTLVYVPLTRTRVRTYERSPDGDPQFISGRGRSITRVVGTIGTVTPEPIVIEAPLPPAAGSGLESIPRATRTRGVWVEYNGERWFSDGAAAPYSPTRFIRAGEYHGFTVYREAGSRANRIWIASVADGPLTPYARR
jgi:hypothetical protein